VYEAVKRNHDCVNGDDDDVDQQGVSEHYAIYKKYFHRHLLLKEVEKEYETEVQDKDIYYYDYYNYCYYMMHLHSIPDFGVRNENERGHEIREKVHGVRVEEMDHVEQYLEKVL
jgi:hypothetical protein